MTAQDILEKLTLQEKVTMLNGKNIWQINGCERLGIPDITVSDGPHGLRKQDGDVSPDNAELESAPAVCYPTSAASACSFDVDLLEKIGSELGKESKKHGVDILLGPGVNHKRSPLCGRNFEYFSEDPIVSGKLGAAYIRGLQAQGVGACLKHFALNSQEDGRNVVSSDADERAKFEIYLQAFELAIREAKPWSVMPSYNRIDETYSCQNSRLLKEIGRERMGFEGAYISDWGAVSDVQQSFLNGLNVEMPGLGDGTVERIRKGLIDKQITESDIDAAVIKIIELNQKVQQGKKVKAKFDVKAALKLAQQAAEESAVLLKNDDALLPLKPKAKIALIGKFSKEPHYQGEGSSIVNPIELDNAYDALKNLKVDFEYAEGYDDSSVPNEDLIFAAEAIAKKSDVAIIFAGLLKNSDAEGFDRENIELPQSHNELIARVAAANPNCIVVLQSGGAVIMPWLAKVKSVIFQYLSGCQGGKAIANLLTGDANPCGKLAESFPVAMPQTPCFDFYHKMEFNAFYAESIFTGYRFYDLHPEAAAFRFGHGLSYTKFEYSNLQVDSNSFKPGGKAEASVVIKNVGNREGKEIVQMYIASNNSALPHPAKELKSFAKISLKPGESKTVKFALDDYAFRFFDAINHKWDILEGEYQIIASGGPEADSLSLNIKVANPKSPNVSAIKNAAPFYFDVESNHFPLEEFAALRQLGGFEIPKLMKFAHPFTINTPIHLLSSEMMGKLVHAVIMSQGKSERGRKLTPIEVKGLNDLTLKMLPMFAQSINKDIVDAIVDFANGKIFSVFNLLRKISK